MKKVSIVGIGVGELSYLHKKAITTIESSDCLIGAKRMIESFHRINKEAFISIDSSEIYDFISNSKTHEKFCVLVSGDTGFYSLSKKLTELYINNVDVDLENIPAISSLQYFCSKLNIPWDDIRTISAHGRSINIISNVMFNQKTFMLIGGSTRPDDICKLLCSKGLGHLKVSVGENLSYENERIIEDRADNVAHMEFDTLAVMIVHNDEAINLSEGLRSIKDDEFITGKVPMTKSEVRTISISKLNLKNDSIVYDIGAGTGSVSIEAALKLSNGTLYAIEKNEEAVVLIKKNIEKFKAYNVNVIKNTAPEGLVDLPKPDCVFIGGSSGNMGKIIEAVLNKNPHVNVVINTIALESLNEVLACMDKYKFENVEVVNVSVSRAKKVGAYNMMIGQNPIYVISGRGSGSY